MTRNRKPMALSLGMMSLLGASGTGQAISIEPAHQLEAYFTTDIALADFDNDGDLDVVTTRVNGYSLLWLNDGTGQFSEDGKAYGDSSDEFILIEDFTGDSNPDLLLGDFNEAKIYENDGNAGLTLLGNALEGAKPSWGGWAAGDLEGDGELDIVTLGVNSSGSTVSIWYGNAGYDGHPDETLDLNGSSCKSLGLASIDGNTGDEIVVGCSPFNSNGTDYPGGLAVWNYETDSMSDWTDGLLETDWDIKALAFIDHNDDGFLDVVGVHFNSHIFTESTGKNHSVWTSDGGSKLVEGNLEFEGNDLVITDVNADGIDDMVISDGRQLRFYGGTTDDGFEAPLQLETCSAYGTAVEAGDVNNDGKTDLVLASSKNVGSDNESDLILIQNADNGVCDDDGSGGGFGGDSGGDNSGDSDNDSGGGGALPISILSLLPGLLIVRRTR